MISTTFKRLVLTGIQNYWRNIGLTIATTLVMTLILFLISIILFLNIVGSVSIDAVKEKVDISVYFSADASEIQIQQIRIDLENIPQVKSVTYVTQEQALEEFRETYSENDILTQSLEELDQNPLQPTLIVKADDPDEYEKINTFLEVQKQEGVVERINYDDNRDIIERLTRGVSIVRNGGFALTLVFFLIAIVVMFNTIRLTIFSRQKEITIMKLVGATNWYIRLPFVIEGLLYGIIASMLGFTVLYPILKVVGPKIQDFFGFENQASLLEFFVNHAGLNFVILLVIGILLGTTSSLIAIRRYLKV